MKEPFKGALPLLQEIQRVGYEAYFVGGSVRDYLLDRPIHDIDIATSATPEEIKKIFPRTIDVGIEHGTVIVLFDQSTYEITTFRSESNYKDFRRPSEVEFIRSIKEDLARRDFTMNAMAMDHEGGIFDPFDGKKDIQEKTIRTVGHPEERFSEDALRILRAIRFVSQLSFTLEDNTLHAIKENNQLLTYIAVERKTMELEKLLDGENAYGGLELLLETEVYQYIPGFHERKKALQQLLKSPIEKLTNDEKWVLLCYFNDDNDKEIYNFLTLLRFPTKRMQAIVSMAKWLKVRSKSDWSLEALYTAGKETALSVEKIHSIVLIKNSSNSLIIELENTIDYLPIHSLKDLSISGKDIIEWKQKPAGPWVKQVLSEVEMEVLYGRLDNNKDAIKKWVKRCNQA